jgi:hypothetical protein
VKALHAVGGVLLAIILGFGAITLLNGLGLMQTKIFAPRYEQVRRETFEQSKAYRQGAVQELEAMHLDYIRATDPEQKAAIKSIVLHRIADYDPAMLTPDLQLFINQLRNEETRP